MSSFPSRLILADRYCGPSLRCEPALTEAIDAMRHPPRRSMARAERIAQRWREIEGGLWPQTGRFRVQRELAVGSITPEYVLVTARTKKYRKKQ
jgi:hypothetical protein